MPDYFGFKTELHKDEHSENSTRKSSKNAKSRTSSISQPQVTDSHVLSNPVSTTTTMISSKDTFTFIQQQGRADSGSTTQPKSPVISIESPNDETVCVDTPISVLTLKRTPSVNLLRSPSQNAVMNTNTTNTSTNFSNVNTNTNKNESISYRIGGVPTALSTQFNNFQLQPLSSLTPTTTTSTPSHNNLNNTTSPQFLNTQLMYNSSSESSSARSSRRPSVIGSQMSKFILSNSTQHNYTHQLPPIRTSLSSGSGIPTLKSYNKEKEINENKDLSKTAIISPVVNPTNIPNDTSSPQLHKTPVSMNQSFQSDNILHSSPSTLLQNNNTGNNNNSISSNSNSSNNTSNNTNNNTGNTVQRSTNTSSNISLRSFKKQYVLNEQVYLERMKNRLQDDEYYTRGIAPSSSIMDSDDDIDSENDDMFGLKSSTSNKINDKDSFGYNFFTTSIFPNRFLSSSYENLLSVNPNFLLNKMEWLSLEDPKKKQLIERLQLARLKNNTLQDTLELEAVVEKLFSDQNIMERIEWQTMLFNVLKGDIVRSEKTKIANKRTNGVENDRSDDLWLELRAWMNGRSIEDQKKSLRELRDSVDLIIEEIINFKVADGASFEETEEIVSTLINKYYKVMNLWPTVRKMQIDKPKTKTNEFNKKVDIMLSWLNVKQNLNGLSKKLAMWIGVEHLNLDGDQEMEKIIIEKRKQFAEQVMKEKDIEAIFQKKIFYPLAPWILKTKLFYVQNISTIKVMNLKFSGEVLVILLLFPMKLLKDIISVRIAYAKKLRNPTMMMIDQMIDDFFSYIRLSVQLKYTLVIYLKDFNLPIDADDNFEKIIIEAIKYLFVLLQLKILDGTTTRFRASKEPDLLLKYWDDLKNIGYYIKGAGSVISIGFSKLTLRLLHRLHSYLTQQQNIPPPLKSSLEAEKWVTQIFENLGSTKRKLNRFTNVLTKAFQNSVLYHVEDYDILLQGLKDSGHFLLYTGGDLEDNGIYLIGSRELLGSSDEEIVNILESRNIGCDLLPKLDIKNSLNFYNGLPCASSNFDLINDSDGIISYPSNYNTIDNIEGANSYAERKHNNSRTNRKTNSNHKILDTNREAENEMLELEEKLQSLGYLLILRPSKPIVWEGSMYNLSENTVIHFEKFDIKNGLDTITLITQGSSYALEYQCDRFQQVAGPSVFFLERKCLVEDVENTLHRINKGYFGCTYSMLNDYDKIISTFQKVSSSSEILNGIYLFTRDFGRNFLKNNIADSEKKSIIIILMVKIGIAWLTFLTEECDPTDQKTFRWCVTAMEFAMQMISGWNILVLDDVQFKLLKQKISACMSLLISHFDVMGARASELETNNQQPLRSNAALIDDFDVDSMLYVNSQLRLQDIEKLEKTFKVNPRQVGKVLDDKVGDNKYITSLASSMSNVSIRWQKRKFVGGGTFGSVYAAINLDNGDILAVKEIKIQDSKAMQKIFPCIKEEMSVMEMLNHPNIIQYYGVEVHRDKVNIFMEYCEGGSLANLLEHGRIEDEMVTQVYTLELLEGLAYLHESGIVHRDIKPENILLDFNGIIKYVDFGAARKIARNGTVIPRASMSMNKSKHTVNNSASTMTSESIASTVHTGESDTKTSSIITEDRTTNVQGMIGTPMYMAPESITGSKHKGAFGADDVWSLGCVVLEMITGRRPWANLDNEWAIMYQVAAGQTPQLPNKDEVSKSGRNFLKRCLVHDPRKRATAVELLMDPWIVDIREIAFGTPDTNTEGTVSSTVQDNI